MNNYPKILNDDGGFKKKIKLNNGKYATLVEVGGMYGHYKIPCPICKKENIFEIKNPESILDIQLCQRYIETGSQFVEESYYSCKYCGVHFEPKLG